MLGKLARWLRMLGQDTIYSTKLNDLELMVKAKKEDRILITRNLNLYKKSVKNKIQSFYIKTQNNSKALANLRNNFGIPLVIDMKISHCPLCNIKLQSIKKQEAAKKIKPNTLLYYDNFWSCSKCLSIYWQGSHWKDITLTLDKAKNFSKF
jgi:uncharacterized protein with PIN domain